MTAGFVLVWTGANGGRHANKIVRERSVVDGLAVLMNRETQGTVYASLPAEELDAWLKQGETDATTEAEAEAVMINSDGDPVPARLVPGRIKLEDQTVRILIEKARAMRSQMAAFKALAFSDITAFLDELAASYGAQRAGRRGGVQLNAYDGLSRVEISVADSLTFGPELEAARLLINSCIGRWSASADDKLKVLVNDAFRVGAGGKIRVDRVIGLRRLEIKDDEWQSAMVAIADAIRVQGCVSYIRFYTRPSQDAKWQQLALDMSAL